MLKRENLALARLGDKAYQWLYVSDNYTMATDGHVIAFAKRKRMDMVYGRGDALHAIQKQGKFLIKKEDALKLLETLPKRRPWGQVKAIFLLHQENGKKRFLVNGLEQAVEEHNACIPNFKRIWPRGNAQFSISFSIDKLLNLLKTLKDANYGNSAPIRFEFYGPDRPAKFTATFDGAEKVIGLIMPINGEY